MIAGHGVGKTSFLVGVALDELLRGGPCCTSRSTTTVHHVRDYYDTVFEELADDDPPRGRRPVRAEIDRLRSIRVYPHGCFTRGEAARGGEARDRGWAPSPTLVVVEGLDVAQRRRATRSRSEARARELGAEVWMSASAADERVPALPAALRPIETSCRVILALEPGDGALRLRALKDHDSRDVSQLHVALDPKTLLLKRS